MAKGPESKLVDKMKAKARAKYGDRMIWVKYHGSAYTQAGVSDLLICLDGVFVAAEVKAPDNYGSVEAAVLKGPTLKQQAFIYRVITAGGVAGVVASVDGLFDLLEQAEQVAQSKRDTLSDRVSKPERQEDDREESADS